MRSNRIRYSLADGEICLFITLTYSNLYVPYVDLSGIKMNEDIYDLPVRRLCSCRYVSDGRGSHSSHLEISPFCDTLMTIPIPLKFRRNDFATRTNVYALRPLSNFSKGNCYGICYYPDLQMFYKRLRQNLKRHYNYENSFKMFNCCEYGSETHRPHFHLLIFIPREAEFAFRGAIVESWPYCRADMLQEYIQIARDCASYVSSYVNGNNHLHSLLSCSCTKQRHSYSKEFGMSCEAFRLGNILEGIDRCSLQFRTTTVADGTPVDVSVSVPQYVINRYFPLIKGYSRIADDTLTFYLRSLASSCIGLQFPRYVSEQLQPFERPGSDFRIVNTSAGSYRIDRFAIAFLNAYKRFHALTGMNYEDYIYWYIRARRNYALSCIKHSFDDVQVAEDLCQHYENIYECVWHEYSDISGENLPTGEYLTSRAFFYLYQDVGVHINRWPLWPADRIARRRTTYRLREKYYRMTKQKCVTNLAMSLQGHDV